ncbi:MAG TPA: glycosyltransferase family 39 protein, partial [Roseateles sp.]|nr:glycosyltransferase family 39 protein [Roseateles sp.]
MLLVLLVLARLSAMAWLPLMDTTEARYGDIGRRMAALGDWVTPWFDEGVPFWGKPPLSFWLTAASMRLFGLSEFAARLP